MDRSVGKSSAPMCMLPTLRPPPTDVGPEHLRGHPGRVTSRHARALARVTGCPWFPAGDRSLPAGWRPGPVASSGRGPCCASVVRDRNGSDDVDQVGLVCRVTPEANAPAVRRTSCSVPPRLLIDRFVTQVETTCRGPCSSPRPVGSRVRRRQRFRPDGSGGCAHVERGEHLGDHLRARGHAGHVLGRLGVDPLGDRLPAGDGDVEEVLVRDDPEAVGGDGVGDGVGDRGRRAALGEGPA